MGKYYIIWKGRMSINFLFGGLRRDTLCGGRRISAAFDCGIAPQGDIVRWKENFSKILVLHAPQALSFFTRKKIGEKNAPEEGCILLLELILLGAEVSYRFKQNRYPPKSIVLNFCIYCLRPLFAGNRVPTKKASDTLHPVGGEQPPKNVQQSVSNID